MITFLLFKIFNIEKLPIILVFSERSQSFEAEKLSAQLDAAARAFINDEKGRNQISTEKARLSMLFKWFDDDFKKTAPTVRDFVNRYAETAISEKTPIEFLDYDWSLNEQK